METENRRSTVATRPLKTLDHGMLLRAKDVMDDALPDLAAIKELVPERLHKEFDHLVARFEDTLCGCDVSDQYVEKE